MITLLFDMISSLPFILFIFNTCHVLAATTTDIGNDIGNHSSKVKEKGKGGKDHDKKEYKNKLMNRCKSKDSFHSSFKNLVISVDIPCKVSRFSGRKREIKNNLDHFIPQENIQNEIVEYDFGTNYKEEYDYIGRRIGNQINSLNFYQNDFLFKLMGFLGKHYFPFSYNSNLFDFEFRDNLLRLVNKWIIFKEDEYPPKSRTLKVIHNSLKRFEKFISPPSIKNDEMENSYPIGKINFLNLEFFNRLLVIECIKQWNLIFPILKFIYQDFYSMEYDRDYIVDKYFHGRTRSDIILTKFIIMQDKGDELSKCLFDQTITINKENCRVGRKYSKERLDDKIKASSFIVMNQRNIGKYELKLLIEGNHKINIDNYESLTLIVEMLKELNLFNKEILIKSILIQNGMISEVMALKILKELNCQKAISQGIHGKFNSLNKNS